MVISHFQITGWRYNRSQKMRRTIKSMTAWLYLKTMEYTAFHLYTFVLKREYILRTRVSRESFHEKVEDCDINLTTPIPRL